jgi:hypothetical protein
MEANVEVLPAPLPKEIGCVMNELRSLVTQNASPAGPQSRPAGAGIKRLKAGAHRTTKPAFHQLVLVSGLTLEA